MTKLPEEKINHKGRNYIATPDPENTKAGRICRELCDLRNTSKCGELKCASKSIHWKKEKVKSSSTPKYKIKDGGFTLDDWLKAESCRDQHFRADFQMLLNKYEDIFKPIKEVPKHIFACPTMKSKFIEFGFVVEVKEEKFYSIGDRFEYIKNRDGDEGDLILCQSKYLECCLVDLTNGNRESNPETINNPHKITETEFIRIIGAHHKDNFRKIN